MPSSSYVDLTNNVGTPKAIGPLSQTPRSYRPSTKSSRLSNVSTQSFKIGHQRVNIDVDLANTRIEGFTEITVVPFVSSLRSIKLDCREITIKDVYINGSRHTNYLYNDKLYINDNKYFDEAISQRIWNVYDLYSDDVSIHQHHLIRQKLSTIFGEANFDPRIPSSDSSNGNTEELVIIFPDNLKLELTDVNSLHTPGSYPGTMTPMHLKSKATQNEVYTPVNIKIEYELANPRNGINFVTSGDKNSWHVYTTNADYNISTSSWVPCLDNLLDRSTWSIEVNIPRTIKDIGNPRIIGSKQAQMKLNQFDEDGSDMEDEDVDLSVCSGDFNNVKEMPHPIDLSKKVVSWAIFNPVCAHHVGWAVGCFESFVLTDFSDGPDVEEEATTDEVEKQANSPITVYCLPEELEMAKNTCVIVSRAMDFYSREFGSFPFSSYSLVFVKDSLAPTSNFAGLSVFSNQILYPSDLMEPIFTSTEIISESISSQWSGINIIPQTFNDIWCTIGIARFMSFQFIRSLMGSNQYRYKIKQLIDQIVRQDIGRKPIALQYFRFPVSDLDLSYLQLKAPVVLFILDKRMTKTDKSFGLSRVLPKLFLQAMSGDLPNGALSTSHFQYTCEKINRNRLDTFFKQWVYGAGTPIFSISQKFNKKRNVIEMSIKQVQHAESKVVHPQPDTFINDSISYLDDELTYPVQTVFTGPMTIRVHEADGTPYEHIVDLKEGHTKLDVHYNSKTRKKKKDESESGVTFSKLGNVLERKRDIEEWSFSDWDKREDENDAFEWIRVDVDFEWIAKFIIKQPDYMYASQLQYDRDVEAQFEATKYFGRLEKPLAVHATVLTRTIMDSRYFYGIRVAAAKALANLSNEKNNFFGVNYLIKIYKQLFCFPSSSIPLSNDFNDFSRTFLQKEIPSILSNIRDENGEVPDSIKNLLLNLVKYNDNSNNTFQDSYYVSDLLIALTNSIVKGTSPSFTSSFGVRDVNEFDKAAINELERIQKLDEWVPSYQYIISTTSIQQKVKLALFGKLELKFEDLLYYTIPKFPFSVRLEAFKGLFLLGALKNTSILNYFLSLCLLEGSSTKFRSNLISVLMDSICVCALRGSPIALDDPEFKSYEKLSGARSSEKGGTNMVIIEEASTSEMDSMRDSFARATIKGAIEILRRDYGIGKGLRKVLWELIHSSLISIYDKRNIFLISQVLYKEIDSFIVKIPIPSLPLSEFNKKIVAKNTGNGKLVFKREGRFKIQLLSRRIAPPPEVKPKMVEEEEIKAEPKLKLNFSLKATDPKKKPVPKKPMVTIDKTKGFLVKLKVSAAKLSSVHVPPTPSTKIIKQENAIERSNVVHHGSMVTFKFSRGYKAQLIKSNGASSPPLRYVRILTNERKIFVSAEPFPVTEPKPAAQPELDSPTSRVVDLVSTSLTTGSDQVAPPKAKAKPDEGQQSNKRSTSSISRSPSPFSTSPSPFTVKKAKTDVYIHGKDNENDKGVNAIHTLSPPSVPEVVPNEVAQQAPPPTAPPPEKKPILKLKLNLKK